MDAGRILGREFGGARIKKNMKVQTEGGNSTGVVYSLRQKWLAWKRDDKKKTRFIGGGVREKKEKTWG